MMGRKKRRVKRMVTVGNRILGWEEERLGTFNSLGH